MIMSEMDSNILAACFVTAMGCASSHDFACDNMVDYVKRDDKMPPDSDNQIWGEMHPHKNWIPPECGACFFPPPDP